MGDRALSGLQTIKAGGDGGREGGSSTSIVSTGRDCSLAAKDGGGSFLAAGFK